MIDRPMPLAAPDVRHPVIRRAVAGYLRAFREWRDADADADELAAACGRRWRELETALIEFGGKAETANAKRRSEAWRRLSASVEKVAVAAEEVRAAHAEALFLHDGPSARVPQPAVLLAFPLRAENHAPYPWPYVLAAMRAWAAAPERAARTTRETVAA